MRGPTGSQPLSADTSVFPFGGFDINAPILAGGAPRRPLGKGSVKQKKKLRREKRSKNKKKYHLDALEFLIAFFDHFFSESSGLGSKKNQYESHSNIFI